MQFSGSISITGGMAVSTGTVVVVGEPAATSVTVYVTNTYSGQPQAVLTDYGVGTDPLRWLFGNSINSPKPFGYAIANNQVPGGSTIIVKWSNDVQVPYGSGSWASQEVELGTVTDYYSKTNGENAAVWVTNPGNYPWRPTYGGSFINSNVSAFSVSYIKVIESTTFSSGGGIMIHGISKVPSLLSNSNIVTPSGVVGDDRTTVSTARWGSRATNYGTAGSSIVAFGRYGTYSSTQVSTFANKITPLGVVAADTSGVGTARYQCAATTYGTGKAIFGYGSVNYEETYGGNINLTNLVSDTGVIATDTTGVGTRRGNLSATGYGADKGLFAYGAELNIGSGVGIRNLVSNTGVVASDTSCVGTTRIGAAGLRYGTDKAIIAFGWLSGYYNMVNLVSNTGVIATDTATSGVARGDPSACGFGSYGEGLVSYGVAYTDWWNSSVTISEFGSVGSDTTCVGTGRYQGTGSKMG